MYGVENWTLQKLYQKYLETFEMWCWRRMEQIIWIDRVRTEDVLQTLKEKRNILHTVSRRTANWTGHILSRNCLLKHVLEEKIEKKDRSDGKTSKKR